MTGRSAIKTKRRIIREAMPPLPASNEESLSRITNSWLRSMIDKYDKLVFNRKLRRLPIRVSWNKRCTSSAGFFLHRGAKIEVSQKVMMAAARRIDECGYVVSFGLPCRSILDCVMHVLEHEMVHAIALCTTAEHPVFRSETDADHSAEFMATAHDLFGHRTYMHSFLEKIKP